MFNFLSRCCGLAAVALIAAGCGAPPVPEQPASLHVTRAQLGRDWPLTVSEAEDG